MTGAEALTWETKGCGTATKTPFRILCLVGTRPPCLKKEKQGFEWRGNPICNTLASTKLSWALSNPASYNHTVSQNSHFVLHVPRICDKDILHVLRFVTRTMFPLSFAWCWLAVLLSMHLHHGQATAGVRNPITLTTHAVFNERPTQVLGNICSSCVILRLWAMRCPRRAMAGAEAWLMKSILRRASGWHLIN